MSNEEINELTEVKIILIFSQTLLKIKSANTSTLLRWQPNPTTISLQFSMTTQDST